VGGEGVPEPVGVGDEPAQRRGVEPAAARGEEEGVVRAARERGARLAQVPRDERRRLLAQWYDTVLRALAQADVHELLLEVDVAEVERDRLRAAQTGRVHELDERAVPQRERPVPAEPVHELVDLLELRCVGEPPRPLRRERRVGNALRPQRVPQERADRGQLPRDRRGRRASAAARPSELGDPVGEHAHVDVLDRTVGPEPAREVAQVRRVGAPRRAGDARGREEPFGGGFHRHVTGVRAVATIACLMDPRFGRLAALAVHGANVQEGQIVMVTAEIGQEALARAVAAAAYDRGALFVDVDYFDPWVKRARIEHAEPDTLEYVPPWYGQRMLDHAAVRGGRVTLSGGTAPNALQGLDMDLAGRDILPRVKELNKIVGERSTNWCIVPCPHVEWARLVHPDLPAEE